METIDAQQVRIVGPEARAFAHAQFSSDVRALEAGHWQFSAWLDASGRVRYLFHLACLAEDDFLVVLRGGKAIDMALQLGMFVLRAKVRLQALDPAPLGDAEALPRGVVASAPAGARLGCGDYSLQIGGSGTRWRRRQIPACWPWLPDAALGACLPAGLDLLALGAAALDKGCYPGQEIVARMHYRGGSKRRLLGVHLSAPVAPGTLLRDARGEWGLVLDVVPEADGAIALASVRIDALTATARSVDVEHDGARVTVGPIGPATGTD